METAFIPYKDEKTELEGFAAFPSKGKHPAVILCHAWKGRDDFICDKAKEIANWGYVGFALDMYGKGVLGHSKEQNAALKKPFIDDRHLLQRRILKAYHTVAALPYVDPSRIAAVGFGFGGLCALDLARSGAPLKGAISIYGHFDPPPTSQPVHAKILILHGYDDPVAPPSALIPFAQEMKHVDWQAHLFGNTQHAFATPSANDPSAGLLYNPLSTKRAWSHVHQFLNEIFH